MKRIITPLARLAKKSWATLLAVEVLFVFFLWHWGAGALIPGPITVARELLNTLKNPEFMAGLLASLFLTLKAMGISMAIALAISYLSLVPLFKPLASFMVKFRYLTLSGLVFLFTLLTQNGSQLKLALLIFGIVPFFVTSLLSIFDQINNQEYELCQTLRMGRWRTLLEVIIIGRADQVIDVMRQNFAIAWLMIVMVEGLSMSEGGLGVMLIKANKYINLPSVFAILVVIFLMGIAFDFALGKLRTWFFPYTRIGVSK